MKRIVHVVTAWPRGPDDVITPWLVTLTERQQEAGHDVHVMAPAYRELGSHPGLPVPVHRFRYAPRRWQRLTHEEAAPDRLQRHPAYALLVPGYLASGTLVGFRLGRELSPDIVHVHWAVPHGPMGYAMARGGGARLVTTFYGAEIRWAENRFTPARAFLRWYTRHSTLVAISRSTRDALAGYTDRPVSIVPYGVPLPEQAPDAELPAGDPVLLFVGRLVARKGVDRLLRALSSIADRPWSLEVVGFGPEQESLEALTRELGLSSRVRFLGRVSETELVAAYQRAACFILPATFDEREDTEGLGVVLLEAMSYGVPVIATRRGGITDIVIDGRTGLLVDDDIGAIAKAIGELLANPDQRLGLGRAGRQRVRSAFSWPSIVDRLDRAYRGEIVGGDA